VSEVVCLGGFWVCEVMFVRLKRVCFACGVCVLLNTGVGTGDWEIGCAGLGFDKVGGGVGVDLGSHNLKRSPNKVTAVNATSEKTRRIWNGNHPGKK